MPTISFTTNKSAWKKLRDMTLPSEKKLCGVCAALGGATPLSAWMWRAIFCFTTLAYGTGLVVYVILAISVPDEKKQGA